MKKGLLLAVLAVMMLVVAACGGGTEQASTNEEATSGAAAQTEAPAAEPATEEPKAEEAKAEEPAAPTEITVTHQLGETVVPVNPAKVVVFDFGTLDSLSKLGVEPTGIPQAGTIPPYLEQYKDSKYTNVGSLVEPDFEAIAGIDPDLILISGRQSAHYEELSKLGPTVFVGIDNKNYMESYKKNATILGQIFQKEDAVAAELEAVEKAVAELNATASASDKKALIVLTNGDKMSAYGPGSRFGIIHGAFGVKAVDENIVVETHGQSITFEFIVEKDPDYLFVVDRGAVVSSVEGAGAGGLLDNELMKNTKAFKNDNIIFLDPNYWYLSGGGLISVSEMVKQVTEGLK
ncbi:siderophore ABC transporter substrate-binding protein [Paenibacillus sp. TRM 82003]|nr:siderophore ABC transporter substrate-binding protein [Paenibacillus sp. TRM 82003]